MTATRHEIKEWLEKGAQLGATHMLVALDTFHYESYPVFVLPTQSVLEKLSKHTDVNKMQRVQEVYNYALDLETQLDEHRAWHIDASGKSDVLTGWAKTRATYLSKARFAIDQYSGGHVAVLAKDLEYMLEQLQQLDQLQAELTKKQARDKEPKP